MNWQDYIVGAIVAVAVVLAVRHFVQIARGKKSGCSSCGSSHCHCNDKTCGNHPQQKEE